MQIPAAQTFVIRQVTTSLSKKIEGEINVERIYFVFFNKAIIKNLSIVSMGDTLLSCNKISLSIPSAELLRLNMNFNRITITGGEFNLVTEDTAKNSNLDRIFRIDKTLRKGEEKGLPALKIKRLKVEDFRFRLSNPFKSRFKGDSIINFTDLDIGEIYVKAKNIAIDENIIRADIEQIRGEDKSGFLLKELKGELTVGPDETKIENLTLRDGFSTIKGSYFSMKYRNARDFAEFTERVELGLDMERSLFSFRTLGKIAPSLSESSLSLILTGEVTGRVCNLSGKGLQIESESSETDILLDFSIAGLPDIRKSICRIDIAECKSTGTDIAAIVWGINGKGESELLRSFSPHIKYRFKGALTGLPDDFVAYGTLNSNIGTITTDILLKNEPEKGGFIIKGGVKSNDFNIGKLIGKEIIGSLTMESGLSAFIKRGPGGISLSIDSLKIGKLEFNGYPYSNIRATGVYDKTGFDGRIICRDPNLNFIFQGLFAYREQEGQYDFYASIPYANLSALNIDRRDSISIIKFNILSNIRITREKNVMGRLYVTDTGYENSHGEYKTGDIELISHNADSNYNAILRAPFMNLEYRGTAPFPEFIKKGRELLLYNNFPLAFGEKEFSKTVKGEYSLDFNLYNSNAICQIVKPGSYIQDSTRCNIDIDRRDNLRVRLHSGRLAVGENYLKGIELNLDNRDSLLNLAVECDNIKIAGLTIDKTNLRVTGRKNRLHSEFSLMARDGINKEGLFKTDLIFKKDSIVTEISDDSFFNFKGDRWHVNPSRILCHNGRYSVEGFALYNNEQRFGAEGAIASSAEENGDTLRFFMEKADISALNFFIKKPFDFQGYFSGNADISTASGERNLFMDLNGDSVSVYGHPVGKMRIMSKWYRPGSRLNLLISARRENATQLMATGYYKPENGEVELNASLNDFSLGYFEPFLSDIISETSGTFSGDLKLEGRRNRLKLTGENCTLNDYAFLVNYTRVPYRLNGPLNISGEKIEFDRVSISDRFNGRGVVTGEITHDNFRDPAFNTRINFSNMQCVTLKESENENFYGEAFASGSVGITGDLSNLTLGINITPDQKSNIHIPLSSTSASSTINLLTFKTPQKREVKDPYYSIRPNGGKRRGKTNLQVNLTSNMNSNANIFIEINKEIGDIIRANGNGQITLNINPEKDLFNIYGDYSINEGSYRFVLPGFSFASRDFVIRQGGNIIFNGGIENTNINLTAGFTTKAAINALIADTSSVSARRNVNCSISMSGRLMNPRLNFDIEIPDLDPTTKVRVESALNSEDKIQKQFAALLISGGFLPSEQSGITNNSTILYSNVSEMISKQINNIFTQLGIPLDLGLNYQPSDNGNNIFDMAVSTQLFNDRLIINGNIGNDPYASTNDREVIGNVDVEIKLDRQGKLRLSLFSHAADKYSNYLDDSQRSGIGLSFRQEFNSFRDIFRKKSKEEKLYRKRTKELRREQRKRNPEKRGGAEENSAAIITEPLQSRQ